MKISIYSPRGTGNKLETIKLYISILVVLLLFSPDKLTAQTTANVYVTVMGSGSKSGTDWGNALDNAAFAQKLTLAQPNINYYVAAGVYYPVVDATGNASPADPRDKVFSVKASTGIYGSFKTGLTGTANDLIKDRVLTNSSGVFEPTTIFSGDFLNNDVVDPSTGWLTGGYSENAYTIINWNAGAGKTGALSGVTVSNSAGAQLQGLNLLSGILSMKESSIVRHFNNVALRMASGTELNVEQSEISSNSSGAAGAGLFANDNTKVRLTQVLFNYNRAVEAAAVYLSPGSSGVDCIINQCTFSNNRVSVQKGIAVSAESSLPITIAYSTFTNNTRSQTVFSNMGALYSAASVTNVYHCVFMGNQGLNTYGSAISLSQYGTGRVLNIGGNIILGNSGTEIWVPAGSTVNSLGYNILSNTNTYAGGNDITTITPSTLAGYYNNLTFAGGLLVAALTVPSTGYTPTLIPNITSTPVSIVPVASTNQWIANVYGGSMPNPIKDQRLVDMKPNGGRYFAGSVHLYSGPVAVDDTVTTKINTPVTIDVLANDQIPGCTRTNVTLIQSAAMRAKNGTVSFDGNKNAVYTPNPGWVGIDSLRYVLTDCNAIKDSATVYVATLNAATQNYAACPNVSLVIGMKPITGVQYFWYTTQTGGTPIANGSNVNSAQVTKDNSNMQSWWAEARYGSIVFSRYRVDLSLSNNCGSMPPDCATGRVLSRETFGHIPPNTSTTKLPDGTTTLDFSSTNGNIGDGQYCIARVPTGYGSFWYYPSWDHTDPQSGYQMIINGAYDPGQFYTVTIKDLCPNTRLYFSAWVSNLMKITAEGTTDPNLRFELRDGVTNAFLGDYTTGPIPKSPSVAWSDMWRQYGFSFTTGASSSIKLTIFNNASGSGTGNDLTLDDIEIRLCTNTVSVVPTRTSICQVGTLRGTYDDTDGSFVDGSGNVGYAWQYSTTGTESDFRTVATGTTTDPIANEYVPTQSGYYRFVVSAPGNQEHNNCRALSTPFNFTIYPIPVIANVTSTTGATICTNETAIISATTDLASVEWYTDAALTNRVGTDLSYTTPPLSASTTYYVVAKSVDGCVGPPSAARSVLVTVNSRPTSANILTTTGAFICTGETATISATTNVAGVEWFSDAALTNRIGTDLSYTTPILNVTTTYYVVARNAAGCDGLPADAHAVTVTVNNRPTEANITGTTGASICTGETAVISATTDAESVEWYSDIALLDRVGTDLSYTTPVLNVNTTYYVVAKNAAGCLGLAAAAKPVTVTVNARPTKSAILTTTAAAICSGQSATISATTNAASVEWYSDAALTNRLGTALSYTTPVLNATTTYYVVAKNAAGCIAAPANATSVTVTVVPLPTLSNVTSTTDATICSGNTAVISATTDASGIAWYTDAALTNKVGSGLSYTTPVLTATTTYYAVATNSRDCSGLPSAAVPVTVTVNPLPTSSDIIGTEGDIICTGQTASIIATSTTRSVEWYTDAALTNLVGTDTEYTTPILTATTTYYVVAKSSAGCIGLPAAARAVTVTVNPRPTAANITGTTPATICNGQTATISATTNAASVEWFTNAALTNRVGTNLSYTTPALSATTTYYVSAKTATGCIAQPGGGVAVVVTVNPRPTAANITGTTPATICTGQTGTISAITNLASVEWFTNAALTNSVGTNLSYTTPALNTTTTYYVAAKSAAGCLAAPADAVPVTVTVNTRPTIANITSTTPATICTGKTATISATTNATSVEWYTDAALTTRVGTSLNYNTPVLTASTTYYLVAKNAAGCIGLPADAQAVTVTVVNLPTSADITSTTPATICSGTTATISATTSMAGVEWFSDAALTNRVGTALSYTTPVLSATTTYYVAAKNATGCVALPAEAEPVVVTVNARPTIANITTATGATICTGQTATISATTDAASVEWYTDATLTNRVGTALSYTTPALSATTTYYVVARNAAGCIATPANARAVVVTVNARPAASSITSATGASICSGTTATISATTNAASVEWYSDAALTNRIGTTLSYTTPALSATTTYYVTSVNAAGCISTPANATPVTVTVNARPTVANITSTTPATICTGQTATISAITNLASVEWFTDAALTNSVGTNLSYTTPALNTTTIYYVAAKSAAGCLAAPSDAVPVTVTVNTRPTAANVTSTTPTTICTGTSGIISATTDAASVEWYTDAALTTRVGTSLNYTTPVLTATTTYYVVAKNAAGCIGLPADAKPVVVTVVPLPTSADITSTTPATICSGTTATISATTSAASVEWFSDAALTTRVGTTLSYTTPVLSATTTYYVVAKNATGCVALPAEAEPVVVTVNARPTIANITTATGATICTGQTATISATTDAASVEWYTDATLTNRVSTALSYTTPALSATTTYYVVARNAAGCIANQANARAVVVTVNTRPAASSITSATGASICSGTTATISATTNAASVEWYSDAALTNRIGTNLSYTTPVLSATTTYYGYL